MVSKPFAKVCAAWQLLGIDLKLLGIDAAAPPSSGANVSSNSKGGGDGQSAFSVMESVLGLVQI